MCLIYYFYVLDLKSKLSELDWPIMFFMLRKYLWCISVVKYSKPLIVRFFFFIYSCFSLVDNDNRRDYFFFFYFFIRSSLSNCLLWKKADSGILSPWIAGAYLGSCATWQQNKKCWYLCWHSLKVMEYFDLNIVNHPHIEHFMCMIMGKKVLVQGTNTKWQVPWK